MKKFYGNYGISCIYQIQNTVNGEIYIGQTKSLVHRHDSENNYKACRKLWKDIEKYGWDKFEKSIVEIVDVSILDEREHHYINTLKPHYNLRGVDGDNIYSIAKSTKELMREAKLKDKRLPRKKVRNITTGEVYDSQNAAAIAVGSTKIAISRVCRGISKSSKGFKWEYVEEVV